MDEFLDVQLMFLVDGGPHPISSQTVPQDSTGYTVTPADPFSDRTSIHEISNHVLLVKIEWPVTGIPSASSFTYC